jgi:hypothetical protein
VGTQTCIFCGGIATLTKDHVIPVQASTAIKQREPAVIRFVTRRLLDGQVVAEYSAKQMEVTAKVVCEPICNNGWMRRLEEAVWPLFSRMMAGSSRTLTLRQQRLLAS